MSEITEYLEATAKYISDELIQIYRRKDHQYGLVFPRKRDGTIRISEQESKTLFLYRVLSERRFCLSVEVPTEQTYRQKGARDMSARVDISLLRGNMRRCAHIEFKAHNCKSEDIRKDLEKLVREKSTGMWFHALENADRGTIKSLIRKFGKAWESLSQHVETCGCSFLIAICVLRKGSLQFKWLEFTGEIDTNRTLVDDAFGEESLSPGTWQLQQFGNHDDDKSIDNINTELSNHETTGKGAREGFFVFVPAIASDTFLHLSERGGSYKIRNYHSNGPNVSPPALPVPSHRSFNALRSSGVVFRWIPVTAEDSTHSLIKEPPYWYGRIQTVNSQELIGQQALLSKCSPGVKG
jgi:hypothetical protein